MLRMTLNHPNIIQIYDLFADKKKFKTSIYLPISTGST